MVKLGVIADDLTGANDTGVQFAKVGLRTIVLWSLDGVKEVGEKADVLVVDTESRGDAAQGAYRKVLEATRSLKEAGASIFYKKVDSTLRGNLGAELDGTLDALSNPVALVAPAYPRSRRITIGGHQLIGGIPLEFTEVAHDPVFPVKGSNIPELIRQQSHRKVGHIPLEVVVEGQSLLKSRILLEHQSGNEIIVLDSAVDDHLRTITQAAYMLGKPVLLCGSAGLAEEIPRAFGLLQSRKGILVVCGSVSAVTAVQVETLVRAMQPKLVTIRVQELFLSEEQRRQEVARVVAEVKRGIEEGQDVIVKCMESPQEVTETKRLGAPFGLTEQEISQLILSTLSEVSHLSLSPNVAGLVLTGGDTAMAVIRALGAQAIRISKEIEAGVPSGVVLGGPFEGLRLVTKAGAFGNDFTLLRVVEYLRWIE